MSDIDPERKLHNRRKRLRKIGQGVLAVGTSLGLMVAFSWFVALPLWIMFIKWCVAQ